MEAAADGDERRRQRRRGGLAAPLFLSSSGDRLARGSAGHEGGSATKEVSERFNRDLATERALDPPRRVKGLELSNK